MTPALALRCARGIGAAGFHRVVAEAGSAEDALRQLDPTVHAEAWARADAVARSARPRGIARVELGDGEYPPMLLALEDPPPVLFALGRLDLLRQPAVAIVGTREATPYGVRVTTALAGGASQAGVTVVSGLARGVDACAHRAALAGRGSTIAVLGTGVDVPYPVDHLELHARIERGGLLVSEALPGARAHRGAFPRRNRIIAALADVVVVTEAGVRSGALITAGVAVAIGRLQGAVPGPVDIPTAAGSNLLLRDGAQVVTCVGDLMGLVHLSARGRALPAMGASSGIAAVAPELSADESRLLDILRAGPRLPDELLAASGMAPAAVAAALATLTILGCASVDASGVVRSS